MEILREKRLVTIRSMVDGQQVAEVAHEALLRAWTRLHDWLDEGRVFRAWKGRTVAARNTWLDHQRHPGLVLRGPLLEQALTMLADRRDDVGGLLEFIEASRDREDVEKWHEQEAVRLALYSEHVLRTKPWNRPLAIGLAVLSMRRAPTTAGRAALEQAVEGVVEPVARFRHDGPVRLALIDVGGGLLATATRDAVRLWNLRAPSDPPSLIDVNNVEGLDFSPDGALLALTSRRPLADIRGTESGTSLGQLIAPGVSTRPLPAAIRHGHRSRPGT